MISPTFPSLPFLFIYSSIHFFSHLLYFQTFVFFILFLCPFILQIFIFPTSFSRGISNLPSELLCLTGPHLLLSSKHHNSQDFSDTWGFSNYMVNFSFGENKTAAFCHQSWITDNNRKKIYYLLKNRDNKEKAVCQGTWLNSNLLQSAHYF